MPRPVLRPPAALSNTIAEQIKRLALKAMFSNDELLEHLVLKGGNALALVHKLTTRQSTDLDFSVSQDFPGGREHLQALILKAVPPIFREAGYVVFDLCVENAPETVTPELAAFWGGYGVTFKVVSKETHATFGHDLDVLRRRALNVGKSTKVSIDISRFEYVHDKQQQVIDGYVVYVYSPLMIVCEKLRALCQQLPAYAPIVKRSGARPGSPRARDFYDIHTLVTALKLDLQSAHALEMLREMFQLKRVPLDFLDQLAEHKDLHAAGYASLRDTVAAGTPVKPFDFYFDFVIGEIGLIRRLLRSPGEQTGATP